MSLVNNWKHFHRWSPWRRYPLKLALFLLITVVVLYPRVWMLPVWLGRLSDLDALIEPNEPSLSALHADPRLDGIHGVPFREALTRVEVVVYDHVPYAFDWDTWGVMDYVPTVREALAQGREDCDGRAVVAASLLRRLGFDAALVCDLKHVWVAARESPTSTQPAIGLMGPGEGDASIQSTPEGSRLAFTPGLIANIGRGLAFGVAVFPLPREVILVAAAGLLTLHPRVRFWQWIIGGVLLAAALALLRWSGASVSGLALRPALSWAGLACLVLGWGVLAWKIRAVDRRCPATPPESLAADGSRPGQCRGSR